MRKLLILTFSALALPLNAQMLGPCTQDTPPGAKCYLIIEMPGGNTIPVAAAAQTQPASSVPAVLPAVPTAVIQETPAAPAPAHPRITTAPAPQEEKAEQEKGRPVRFYVSLAPGISSVEYKNDDLAIDIHDSWVGQFNGAAGIALVPLHLRAEAAFNLRGLAETTMEYGGKQYDMEMESYSLMLNAYLDITTPWNLPDLFVGGGIGRTYVDYTIYSSGPYFFTDYNDSETYDTYALYAGLTLPINKYFFVDLTGTYYNVKVDEGKLDGYSGTVGLRFMF